MDELERQLRELGRELPSPEAPDVASRVRAQLEREAVTRRRPTRIRRSLVPALVATLAFAGIGYAAVPDFRDAVKRLLGVDGAVIERTPTTPEAPLRQLDPGPATSVAAAEEEVGFTVPVPHDHRLGEPDSVHVSDKRAAGGLVTLIWKPRPGFPERRETGVGVVFSAFEVTSLPFIYKTAGPRSRVERVEVNGETGYWVSGDPHALVYQEPSGRIRQDSLRLAGPTLVWESEGLTLRLEGAPSKRAALRIAESVR